MNGNPLWELKTILADLWPLHTVQFGKLPSNHQTSRSRLCSRLVSQNRHIAVLSILTPCSYQAYAIVQCYVLNECSSHATLISYLSPSNLVVQLPQYTEHQTLLFRQIMPASMQRPLQHILAKNPISGPVSIQTNAVDNITQQQAQQTNVKPPRPCDACRKRKSRCLMPSPGAPSCLLCSHHNQLCTFLEDPIPRKKKPPTVDMHDPPMESHP